jgi:DNA-binding NarL/FixJ family response regulator
MSIRIVVADDHPMMRAGLAAVIALESDLVLAGEATNGREAVELCMRLRPDVMLMDLGMPVMGGVEAIHAIMTEAFPPGPRPPTPRIVVLTIHAGDADINRALDAGAVGYLLKDMVGTEIIAAVRAAARGERVIPPVVAERAAEFGPRVDLTARELEVMTLLAKGLRNREIAAAIGRSEETVKVHVRNLLAKLGAEDRTQAVALALERGIVRLS